MARDPSKKDDGRRSPWLEGASGVTGVVPRGRRLSPPSERRDRRWSASGVAGVTPPGRQKPGTGPASESAELTERKRAAREKAARRALADARSSRGKAKGSRRAEARAPDLGRPSFGFVPDAFRDGRDPTDLKGFLEEVTQFVKDLGPEEAIAESFAQVVLQSHAPHEIVVAFTILSTIIGKSTPLRRRYTAALERGAKTFFNLATRLDKTVKAPRGLVPETMDAIFYDLPRSAYQVPYAFLTDAFCRMADLFRGERDVDRPLFEFVMDLRRRFIECRSLGDKPLEDLFPWSEPDGWCPEEE